jgi:putative acetyltransferase
VTPVRIEARTALDPELAALIAAQQRESRALFAPHGDAEYLVAVMAERVVAYSAWQPIDDDVAEVRQMYVRPAFRNRGIARQMIVAIEEEALAADRPVIRLETGRYLPAAIALYQSSGYHQIAAYGEYEANPYSVCFEKRLAALVQ